MRPNFWPNTPDILAAACATARRPRSGCGSSWPRRWCRATASTPATSCARTSRPTTPTRSTCTPRSTRSRRATGTRSRLARAVHRTGQRDPPRHPALSVAARHPVPPQRQRPAPRLHAAAHVDDDLVLVVVNLDPHNAQETRSSPRPRRARPPARAGYDAPRRAHRRHVTTWDGDAGYVRLDPATGQVAHIFHVTA